MLRLKDSFFIMFISLFICGCIGAAHYEELNGGYYLSALDVEEEMTLVFHDGANGGYGVIGRTIFAVGQNDEFIIVKQHPNSILIGDLNKKITNYYIVPLKNRTSELPEQNFYGPLTEDQFNAKARDLKIENLTFSKIFKNLE